ncbi:MAG: hypothetical protein QM640_11135 [Niabella sp.]
MKIIALCLWLVIPLPFLKAQSQAVKITVQADQPMHQVNPGFWGTNFLYWIDDDASLDRGTLVSRIKEGGIRLLRYPGGTVADNFHWKSSTLDNVNMFPYESGTAETDFDEFMEVCRQTGAEPMCVLNTESWAVRNDIAGGAHEAAEWLRYCKKKGYPVRYWEIGNETYWHPVLSAREYAALVRVYADSMKSVDADVILGINGHWDTQFVGTKERVKKGALPRVLEYRRNINSREDAKRYDDFLKSNTIQPITEGSEKWWEILAAECADKIDMIIVHWYFSPQQLDNVYGRLTKLRRLLERKLPGKKFLYNMSEYNVTTRTPESYMHLTEMMGTMLKAGIDISALWPMRMKYKKPTYLDYKTHQPSILYQVVQQLSRHFTGDVVNTESADIIPVFAAHNKEETTTVLSGRKIKSATSVALKVQGSGKSRQHCKLWRISGEEFDYKIREEQVPVQQEMARFSLEPSDIVLAMFY